MKMAELDKIGSAIIRTMEALRSGIKKNATVGSGNYQYKGVTDMDVKSTIGKAMQEAGLSIVPIEISPTMKVETWQEGNRTKNQVFCEVRTKYLLIHGASGQNITIEGYGHGIDSADKAAGKATTYALKYALLYTFMVPTGDIDDTDGTHSEDLPQKPAQSNQNPGGGTKAQPTQQKPQTAQKNGSQKPKPEPPTPGEKMFLHQDPAMLTKAIERISKGLTTIDKIEGAYKLNEATRKVLISYQNHTNH